MLSVQLVNGDLTVDLDEISQDGAGVEAVAGMTGLGLPPVSVQWLEGAGDGAKARNIRVLPRDIDIPLHVFCEDRDELRAAMRRVSLVLAGELRLYLLEDGVRAYYADVVRTGGGTYTYGSDSAGEYDWSSIVTVRAGVPYWTHVDAETVTHSGDLEAAAYTITNPGTASAKPVWTINGPLNHFRLARGDKVLDWWGDLGATDAITVDTDDCSVRDQTGANRYSGLATAPDMWDLSPGANDIAVTLDKFTPTTRTNWVTNPRFGNVTHGWTVTGTGTVAVVSGALKVGTGVSTGTATETTASKTITGFSADVGKAYVVRVKWGYEAFAGAAGTPVKLKITVDGVESSYGASGGPGIVRETVKEFVVPASGSVTISATTGTASGKRVPVLLDEIYVGLAGDYFDGASTDSANYDYAWTGTADASTSTATYLPAVPDPSFTLTYEPRDWMEV